VRRILPFATVALFALIVGPISGEPIKLPIYLTAAVLTLLAVSLGAWAAKQATRSAAQLGAPLVYIVAVAFLRDSQDGAHAGYNMLVLLPVIWVALYFSTRATAIVVAAMALSLVAPVWIEGPPNYPPRSLIQASLIVLIGVTLAMTINSLVSRLTRAAELVTETVHSALDGFFSCTLDGRVLVWNPQAEAIFGWPASEAIGRVLADEVFSAETRAELRTLLDFDPRSGGPRPRVRIERPARRRDGRWFEASLAINVVRSDDGYRYNVFVNDVTESRRIALSLATSEQRFRNAFDLAPIGMVLATLDGRFERVNDAFCELIGFARDELEHESINSVLVADDLIETADQLQRLLNREQSMNFSDARLIHRNGEEIWVQAHRTIVYNDDNEPSHVLAQIVDVTSRRVFENQLQHLADHDPLTGLLNRRGFNHELQRHMLASRPRGSSGGALLALDLDGFKYINDTLGHEAGDALIVGVARILQDRLRSSDVIARLGGDEFAILLPRSSRDGAVTVAESIVKAVRLAELPGSRSHRPVTVSIGIADFAVDGLSADQVMVNADMAMYDAKELGRDRVECYSDEAHRQPRIKARLTWMEKIDAALNCGGFALEAMPIIDLRSGSVQQYELLVRMRDDDGHLIAPALFLDVAERFDVVHKIDQWVATQAIRLLHDYPSFPYSLAVNVSGKSIADTELLLTIRSELRATGVDPARLTFELTETAAVADVLAARHVAESLHQVGCKFALDDFGAGFGSFYYLKHLPFDYIKIDGEFVKNCRTDRTNQLIITSLVNIARGLGRHTVGEYTADQETYDALRNFGVDFAQGYHIGKPIPIERLLAQHGPTNSIAVHRTASPLVENGS
jgi:diguanylate cyclase (GGDEF)-like protein/PAS domain S-box-containing protein